jgi:hypothetical protein
MRVTTFCISIAIVPVTARAQSDEPEATPAPTPPFHLTEAAPVPRPAALMPLYGSLIGLQALDVDSTRRAVASGAGREANPLMRSVVGQPAALIAVKAGATGAIIFASERLRKAHHPVAAVMMMIGINSAYAMIVAHNYAVANAP